MGSAQRRKGHNFEREVARMFRDIFPDAKRHLEYQESEASAGVDVVAGPFAIQCKRKRKYSSVNTIKEIEESEKIPLLITKPDREKAMVVISLSNFLDILKGDDK